MIYSLGGAKHNEVGDDIPKQPRDLCDDSIEITETAHVVTLEEVDPRMLELVTRRQSRLG